MSYSIEDLARSGIYCIRNTVNGKLYVGSTGCFQKRWRDHQKFLKRGVHPNRRLQASYKKHGITAFEFHILEIVSDVPLLIEREQFWIDHHDSSRVGYNMCPIAGSTAGKPFSEAARQKLSKINLGKPNPKNTRLYIVTSPEGVEQEVFGIVEFCVSQGLSFSSMIAVARGRRLSHQGWKCRYADLEQSALFQRERLSAKFTWILTDPNGVEHEVEGLYSFCKEHNLSEAYLGKIARGKHFQHKGWTCRFADPEMAAQYTVKTRRRWKLISPLGEEFETDNLEGFSKPRGLTPEALAKVAKGITTQHKGWKCQYANPEDAKRLQAPPERRCKQKKYLIVSPTGEEFVVGNLQQFCSSRGMNPDSFYQAAIGRYKTCNRGWTCQRISDTDK